MFLAGDLNMAEPQLTQIVAGCVLQQDGKYLLVQEKKESAYALWGLPAGRVDMGETFEQTAVREVFEETCYKVELVKKLRIDHSAPTKPVLHSYLANIVDGKLSYPKEDLLDAQWLTLEEIESLWQEGKVRAKWVVDSIKEANR